MLQELIPYRKKVDAVAEQEVGKTRVFLDGNRLSCRMIECNLGNMIADAYVDLVRDVTRLFDIQLFICYFLWLTSLPSSPVRASGVKLLSLYSTAEEFVLRSTNEHETVIYIVRSK